MVDMTIRADSRCSRPTVRRRILRVRHGTIPARLRSPEDSRVPGHPTSNDHAGRMNGGAPVTGRKWAPAASCRPFVGLPSPSLEAS